MSSSSSSSSSSKRHPLYHGIRCRSGKWVSEIREPRKTSRIWLGTFPTPEMAAAAFDVAASALKGSDADLNFPGLVHRYPVPVSNSAADIRSAATAAAAMMRAESSQNIVSVTVDEPHNGNSTNDTNNINHTISSSSGMEYVDEDAIFGMPGLLMEMAEGMLLSPPRINPPPSDDSPEKSVGDSLWGYF